MNPTDRVVVGLALLLIGAGIALAGWSGFGALLGIGTGMLITGVRQLRRIKRSTRENA